MLTRNSSKKKAPRSSLKALKPQGESTNKRADSVTGKLSRNPPASSAPGKRRKMEKENENEKDDLAPDEEESESEESEEEEGKENDEDEVEEKEKENVDKLKPIITTHFNPADAHADAQATAVITPSKKVASAAVQAKRETPNAKLYAQAQNVFKRCATPRKLVGRQPERLAIQSFLNDCLGLQDHLELSEDAAAAAAKESSSYKKVKKNTAGSRHSGSIYISGVPGTGKTALCNEILDGMCEEAKPFSLSDISDTPTKSDGAASVNKKSLKRSRDSNDAESFMEDDTLASKSTNRNAAKAPFLRLFINCMGVTPKQIYVRALSDLHEIEEPKNKDRQPLNMDETYVALKTSLLENTESKKMIVLVLDEIDHLMTKDQDILYSFFEWARTPGSRLILIGIANALDLTMRHLPRLKTKNFEPVYLSFAPYEVNEIKEIIKDRLRELEPGTPLTPTTTSSGKVVDEPSTPSKVSHSIMHPMAIELAARKLAGTGDLRKALDVCRHAISMVEGESNLGPDGPPVQVTVKHILKATNSLLNGSAGGHVPVQKKLSESISGKPVVVCSNPTVQRIMHLTIQPKIVLVLLVTLAQHKKIENPTFQELFGYYKTIKLSAHAIQHTSTSGFQDLISQMVDSGLVRLQKIKKEERVSLVASSIDITQGVKESRVIQELLNKGLNHFKPNHIF